MSDLIQVQATQPGFYATYKNPGDKFAITREGDFSHNWMIRLSPMPEKEETTQAVPAGAESEVPRQKRKYVRKQKVGE